MAMTAFLQKGPPETADASISAAERRIDDRNERIILDLMLGRDTSADEEKVARELVSLARLRGRRAGPGRRAPR